MARPRDGDATEAQGRFMAAVSSGRLGGVLMAAKSPARHAVGVPSIGGAPLVRRVVMRSRGAFGAIRAVAKREVGAGFGVWWRVPEPDHTSNSSTNRAFSEIYWNRSSGFLPIRRSTRSNER